MKMNRSVHRKVVSLLLTLALLLSCMPVGVLHTVAAQATTGVQSVDDHTLDQWKQYFGIQTDDPNNVSLSTEFVGSVWTDKSVFDPGALPSQLTDAKYKNNSFTVTDKGDNFVVALSAIASNKEIVGYSTIPTDTVLILDLSSSMRSTDDNGGSAVDELVEASNKAISQLLELNKNNRVAVVVYAGNTNKSFSNAQGITKVILPLDSYTTQNGVYLNAVSGNQAIEVSNSVRNSGGNSVSTNKMEISTGTYMQDGIYEAMRVLLNADPVVQSGVQAGTGRMPIMVLMTDGEPTLANADYNGNDARTDLGSSVLYDYNGTNGTNSHRDTFAFLTSLTAAFAKKTVAAHYDTNALFYTLPYGQAVFTRPEALSVMNPEQASNEQNAMWNDFLDGDQVNVYRTGSRNNYQYTYVTNSTVADEQLTAADRLYVDKYFPARNDDAMLEAFDDIVAEIIIQSKYYPTYTESDPNHDGYLTFVDKIGQYMQVVDVQGIVIGQRLFSGAALASSFNSGSLGTVENPTEFGDELIRSVKSRLGIPDTAMAQALVANAWTHGQLAYTNDSDFSHYIGWFSDADGNYVDFWHEGMTTEQIQAVVDMKGATHIIKSYGFLGDTTVVPGVNNTDMMFMSVRVSRQIATDEYMITWQIPASLVPTVTYEVEVEVNNTGDILTLTDLALESGTAEDPIRLLYEVALREDITDWNMAEKVSADYVQANGYSFYTNKWDAEPENTSENTYAHFEPSVENERYYYTQDTEVMVQNGGSYAPYTGAKPSGSGYYHSIQVFERLENGTLRIHTHYEPISSEAMEAVQQDGAHWVIPKDTIHRYYDYEITDKVVNRTATMGHTDHPFVVKSGEIYYTYSTHGNNGKLTAVPATGIKLTKLLAEGFTSNEAFTFVVAGSIAGAQVVRLDENGNETSRSALPASGEVTLTAGESVYILGLTAGSYTVSEKIATGADYHVSAVAVNGVPVGGITANLTVVDQSIQNVAFTNAEQGYGDLVVSKDVNYPQEFSPVDAHNAKAFTINVTFDGDISAMVAPAGAVKNGNTYTLTLLDGESATFSNILEGVTYTVTETGLTAGYTNQDIRYSNADKVIASATTDQVHVVNAYAPAPANVDLTVRGIKTVTGGWPTGESFTVRLWEVIDFGSGQIIDTQLTDVVTESDAAYEIDMSSLTFDKVGTYNFRVVEDIPENRIPDMAYDRTYGLFSVTVTDEDADGQLEIAAVQNYQHTGLTGNIGSGWVVTKDFTNVVTKDIVYLDVQKRVVDADDPGKTYTDHLADITFGLFASMTDDEPSYYILTDGTGKGTIAVPVSQASLGAEGKVFYLREIAPATDNRLVGMNYDESWIYALRIKWDAAANVAVTEYAAIVDGQQGAWTPFDFEEMVFTHTNLYESQVQSTPAIELSGVKTLNGGNELGGRDFSFSIYNATAAFVIQGEALQTVTNNGNAVTFDGIRYDTPGLHYLVVKENTTALGGVTIDPVEYHITVLVEKYSDADGTTRLRVASGYPTVVRYGTAGSVATDALNFNNRYTVTGTTSATIGGSKTLTGRPMLTGEFRFRLTEVADESGTALPGGLVLETENGPADSDTASFRFAPITYAGEGTHYYQITEVAGEPNVGVTYSTDSFLVKVVVSDNGVGGLACTQSVVDGRTVAFVNSYKPSGIYTDLLAAKELTGKTLRDSQFAFTVLQTQQDFATAVSGGLSKSVKNNAWGVIDFGRIYYTEEGTYYYVIREDIPADPAPGVAYDATVYHVTVRVVDNHRGALEVFSSTEMVFTDESGQLVTMPSDSIVFYNRYTISGSADVIISGTKTLTGRELKDGEFTFELYKTDASYTVAGVTPETTVNTGNTFSFRLNYLPEDVGSTFYYVLQEKNAGTTVDGVTYSNARYIIQVQVMDNDAGGIRLEVTADGLTVTTQDSTTTLTGAAFENTYARADAELQLTVKKTMTGDETNPAGFSFGLYAQGATTALQTVTSDADGVVSFSKLTYSEPGTHTYVISEILPVVDGKTVSVKDNITYDTTQYKVVVTVSDDGKGSLTATYTVNNADVDEASYQFAFNNQCKKPAVTPQTGDDFQVTLYVALMVVSATALFVLLLASKRRKHAK